MVVVCGCGLWFFLIIKPTLVLTLTLNRVWQYNNCEYEVNQSFEHLYGACALHNVQGVLL